LAKSVEERSRLEVEEDEARVRATEKGIDDAFLSAIAQGEQEVMADAIAARKVRGETMRVGT
jgi:hypothetical protein